MSKTKKYLPNLLINHEKISKILEIQIQKGCDFKKNKIQSEKDLKDSNDKFDSWHDYTITLLRKYFDSDEIADEFSEYAPIGFMLDNGPDPFSKKVKEHYDDIKEKIDRLLKIQQRIHLYDVVISQYSTNQKYIKQTQYNKIFIVHGHDLHNKREVVARFLQKLNIEGIILHEKPNEGCTIIEKIEKYAEKINFAIVLMTPDDIIEMNEKRIKRARQNVIFELGFFLGKYGRNKLCAIYEEEVEMLSDYSGVLYIKWDNSDNWKIELAKELKAAGFEVDFNKIL